MTREEPFVSRETPEAARRPTRFEIEQFVDEEKRRAMRKDVDRTRQGVRITHDQAFNAFSKLAGVSLGDTLYHACSILPLAPIRNAERSIPM